MRFLIRVVWFFISMLLYNPIMRGLDAIGVGFFLKAIVALAIFFFIYYIPSNAFISMFTKSPKQRLKNLSTFLWQEAKNYARRTGRVLDEFLVSYFCAAFYYTVMSDIQYYRLEEEMQRLFLDTGVSVLSPISSSHPRILRDSIDWVFTKAIREFQEREINPFLEGGPTKLFEATLQLYDPDAIVKSEEFIEFTASLVKVSEYFSRLLK